MLPKLPSLSIHLPSSQRIWKFRKLLSIENKIKKSPVKANAPFKKTIEKIITTYDTTLNLYPISNAQVILVEGEKVEVKER
jgi:hypothetical protein